MMQIMIPNKALIEPDMGVEESESSSRDRRNRGGAELKKKRPKKLRSIKLSRLSSVKLVTRQSKFQFDDAASQDQSVFSFEMSDASPNYMRPTSCSDGKKENFQKPARLLTRRSSFKPGRTLTRMSSLKFKRPLTRKLKQLESAELASFDPSRRAKSGFDHPSAASSCSDGLNVCSQASPHNSESSFGSNDPNINDISQSKSKSASLGNKSLRILSRKPSIKPVRILTRMASKNSKKFSIRKSSKTSQFSDLSINKATCSSALKDSKFPDHAELHQGDSESEVTSVMRVCPYTYCSLHGHRHAALPPLQRFVSMRRRLLMTQKSKKPESRTSVKTKRSGTVKKGIQKSQMVSNGDAAVRAKGIERKKEIVISDSDDGDNESTLTDGLPREIEDAGLCNKHLLKADNIARTFHETVPVGGEVSQEDHEEIINSESYGKSLDTDGSSIVSGAQPDITRSATPCNPVESTAFNGLVSSASVGGSLAEPTAANEENLEPENGILQGFPTLKASESVNSMEAARKAQLEKQKYNSMWNLIYQHMVSDIAEKDESQLLPEGASGDKEMEDAGSCQVLSQADQPTGMETDAGRSKVELCQTDVVKLVQEAINKILLQDTQNQSGAQSTDSDIIADQEPLEKNNVKDGELSISAPTSSSEDGYRKSDNTKVECRIAPVPEEEQLGADNITSPEEEKAAAATKVGNKTNLKISKSWSNLKRLLVLKRFIKALEKMRSFNPKKPQYLALEPNPEAEKVNLRHQMMEERKNAEEWMLDHALRQVISKLAPAQKRRVSLLVEAFETVIPPQETETHMTFSAANSPHGNPAKTCSGLSVRSGTEAGKEPPVSFHELQVRSFIKTKQDFSVSEANDGDCKGEEIVASHIVRGDNNHILTDDQPDSSDSCLSELRDPRLCDKFSLKPYDTVCNCHEEVQVDGKVLQEADCQEKYSSNLEFCDGNSDSNSEMVETDGNTSAAAEQSNAYENPIREDDIESTAGNSVVSPASVCDPLEEPTAASKEMNGEAKPDSGILQVLPPLEKSEPDSTTDVVHEAQMEKQSYTRLWYLIYKHMASGVAPKDGNQLHFYEADKEEQVDDANSLLGTNVSDLGIGNHDAGSQKIELCQIEAIKMVEEAIDEILLPDNQECSSDDRSVTSDTVSDREFLENSDGQGVHTISISTDCAKHSIGDSNNSKAEYSVVPEPEETGANSENNRTQEEEKTMSKVEKKYTAQKSKNWSNLKKLILLKRFVKALEKVKKFNPRGPQFLPLESDQEAEKVNLRHQNVDDRRGTEEWMLDFALQQVVAKLTPARKRKVGLLVEAFESISPSLR